MTSERIYRIIASIGICASLIALILNIIEGKSIGSNLIFAGCICACSGCLFTQNAQKKKQNDNHSRKDEHHE